MDQVAVIGAGVGGLVAALELAHRGLSVRVLERAARAGGKLRVEELGGESIDAGPTVFTMRWVFEQLCDDIGESLDGHLTLQPAERLARHVWPGGATFDLFADIDRSADAVGALAGAGEARRFLRFCNDTREIYSALERPFIRASRPSIGRLLLDSGFGGLGGLMGIRPFARMTRVLSKQFKDPRLRQLFGRYATYCGSSPHLAPATLLLVAHVEQEGVWFVEGGMRRLVDCLVRLAEKRGVVFEYSAEVQAITVERGRVAAVGLEDGRRIVTNHVVVNADVAALADGLFGRPVSRAVSAVPRSSRSLSALTWAMRTRTGGFPLVRHNVFFSDRPGSEFHDIFGGYRLPAAPTVYVCAQDRGDRDLGTDGPERLLCLVNAPAIGDVRPLGRSEVERCERVSFGLLEACGLQLPGGPANSVLTTPADFARRFPATGGALYGRASHGWKAAFQRPGARTPVPGLYLAGGSTHPGPGVPMAAISGRHAAACLMDDLGLTLRSRKTATRGGMSMA